MLRVVISILLCASLYEASAENKAKIHKEIKLWYPYSQTVEIESDILTIAQNSTHLHVNSTDSNFKPCAIALEEHTFQKRIEAMEISRKIIVWGVRAKYETDIGDRIEHTVLIVDPWQCSFKVASTFEEERPSGWWSNENAQVAKVGVQGLIDVFYPSLKTCAPCRYSLDGKRIDLRYQLEMNYTVPKTIEHTPFFRIKRYYAYNTTGRVNTYGDFRYDWGYIFAYNFENGSSVVKILDENFHASRQRHLDHRTDGIAVSPNSRSDVYVCYMTETIYFRRTANDLIYCESLDERDLDMKLMYTIRLPMLEGYAPDALSMNTILGSELYVSVAQSLPKDSTKKKFGLYWIRSSGTLMDSATFYELPEGVDGQWRVRSYFTDNDNVYCIENTADHGWRVAGHEFVKCAALRVVYRPVLS